MKKPANKQSCLHLLVRSSNDALELCCSQFAAGDAIVFVDAGVMHLLAAMPEILQGRSPVLHYLLPDLEARGLQGMAQDLGVNVLEDKDFAGLLRAHDRCVTWK
jgi:sulfur relay protein TusB/DsrH